MKSSVIHDKTKRTYALNDGGKNVQPPNDEVGRIQVRNDENKMHTCND